MTVFRDVIPHDVPKGYARARLGFCKFYGGQFYTKVDPDGKGIENVTFQMKDGDTVLYFVKQNDGSNKKAASAATSDATPDVKTDANGKLTFTGLDAAKVAEGSRLTGDFVAL